MYPHKNEPLSLPWTAPSGKFSVPDASIGLAVPALAAADGVVTRSSRISTGQRVRIDHGRGLASAYMHMRNRRVQVGDRVRAGQPVGTVAFGDKFKLNHLHFEAYRNGVPVDPEPLLRGARVVALPTSDGKWLLAAVLAVGAGIYVSRFIR
jgi:murein DD-endopeptidase MepM/ murein hydrolase activator NlpD